MIGSGCERGIRHWYKISEAVRVVAAGCGVRGVQCLVVGSIWWCVVFVVCSVRSVQYLVAAVFMLRRVIRTRGRVVVVQESLVYFCRSFFAAPGRITAVQKSDKKKHSPTNNSGLVSSLWHTSVVLFTKGPECIEGEVTGPQLILAPISCLLGKDAVLSIQAWKR